VTLGRRVWAIADGVMPDETACVLNPNDDPADLEITLYFAEREPLGPFRLRVEPRRVRHVRVDELVGIDGDFALVLRASVPVVLQQTRLDGRPQRHSQITMMAWPAG
jgi:hypothetical protein